MNKIILSLLIFFSAFCGFGMDVADEYIPGDKQVIDEWSLNVLIFVDIQEKDGIVSFIVAVRDNPERRWKDKIYALSKGSWASLKIMRGEEVVSNSFLERDGSSKKELIFKFNVKKEMLKDSVFTFKAAAGTPGKEEYDLPDGLQYMLKLQKFYDYDLKKKAENSKKKTPSPSGR